jgi:large subunit ribosomal protein L15e
MSLYKYIREAWKSPKDSPFYRERMIKWRSEPAIVRLDHPTRLDRARSLGYKAKPGFVLLRVRLPRGSHERTRPKKARRSKRKHIRKNLQMNYKWIAEQRAVKQYPNCEVLNSYWIGKDGHHYFFDVILIDRAHPQIQADPILRNIAAKRGRVYRGLTASGRRSRMLRWKGTGAEKARPSREKARSRTIDY